MRLQQSRAARKFMRKLIRSNPADAKKITARIHELLNNPAPPKTLMRGESEYRRLRIGNYRVVYFIAGDTIHIHTVGKRNDDEVYKQQARRQ